MPGDGDAPETYWPVFLDQVPSSGTTVQQGSSEDQVPNPGPAGGLRFQCRCGCRLVAKPELLDRPTRCPQCVSRIIIRVGYKSGTKEPVPLLDYLDNAATT